MKKNRKNKVNDSFSVRGELTDRVFNGWHFKTKAKKYLDWKICDFITSDIELEYVNPINKTLTNGLTKKVNNNK